jgi:hypothetical protein
MTTIAQYYERVNEAWGHGLIQVSYGHKLDGVAPPTPEEAVKGAAKLWRFATGASCPYDIYLTSGNRDTGQRYSYKHKKVILFVNAEQGWYEIVHHLAHLTAWHMDMGKTHSKQQARHELKMVKEVIKRGWLDGSLKPAPKFVPVVNKKLIEYERALAAIKRWEAKAKRAKTAIAKLSKRKKYYEKALAT